MTDEEANEEGWIPVKGVRLNDEEYCGAIYMTGELYEVFVDAEGTSVLISCDWYGWCDLRTDGEFVEVYR